MREAVVVEAVRTPVGRRGGALAGTHAVELAATVLNGVIARAGIDPGNVDDVILGCVSQVGEQSANIARNAWLGAGLPETVPATTIDRQCGSSQQALHFAAQGIQAGAYDLVVAGGVEHMTRVPLGSSMQAPGTPFGPLAERYGGVVPHQGVAAELVAERWRLDREALDAYSARSHQRAAAAADDGRFAPHILPVTLPDGGDGAAAFDADEGIRRDTSPERLAALRPAFVEGGRVTAGNSSQISDGAAALVLASGDAAQALGLRPLARIHATALAATDPVLMLTAIIPATRRVLERAGLRLGDMDVIEVNEAFASVVLAWGAEMDPDWELVNPLGGAIALGHPLGASGARISADLLGELERRGGRYGLQVMCEGGGMANATIFERLS